MLSWKYALLVACLVIVSGYLVAGEAAGTVAPKPKFQNDFFGDMARAFGVVTDVDVKGRTLEIKRERDGQRVRVPIRDDTELHFRDSWGELENYFPGERVMLFVYVDEEKKWTYPRAVQDEIHVSARHGWFGKVTAIDAQNHTYSTHREEKDKEGKVTKSEDKQFAFAPDAKVWKSDTAGGIDALQIGDEVIPQQVERDGKLMAVEIFDRKGDDAVRAVQDAQHKKDQDRLGLTAYVTDVEVLSGALTATVAWSSASRAKELPIGAAVAIVPADGARTFAGTVCSVQGVDSRQRVLFNIHAHVAARLSVGQGLRIFIPGTGPELPTGKSGVPEDGKK